MRNAAALLVQLAFTATLFAQSLPPVFRPDGYRYHAPVQSTVNALALRTPDVTLDEPVRQTTGGIRAQNGIVRALDYAWPGHTNRIAATGAATAVFRSAGADQVRLHLTQLQLHAGAELTVSGADGMALAVDTEFRMPDGSIWTPSVAGDTVVLTFPAASILTVADIAHIFRMKSDSTACFVDVTCTSFPDKSTLSAAVAQLQFVNGSSTYVCTGGLINSTSPDRLLLTANHCISTQAEAASLQATFDLTSASCGNTATPNKKVVNGASLLVASATTDVSLLRLNSLPPNRYLMGWTTTRPANGTTLYRISHPYDDTLGLFSQVFSTTSVNEQVGACGGAPRPNFLYSVHDTGGIEGGSSGSVDIIQGGYIVAQLYGLCGPGTLDGCSSTSNIVEGSLGQSFPILQPYLQPSGGQQCATCTPDATTACALGGRFKVTISWIDSGAHLNGSGTIIHYADNVPKTDSQFGTVSESIFFSFYSFAATDVEALVRMINGHGINDKFWVFATGFTGAQYSVTIQDTKTCAVWQHTVNGGATDVVKDFNAFPLP